MSTRSRLTVIVRAAGRRLFGAAGPFVVAAAVVVAFNGLSPQSEDLSPPPPAGADLRCGVAEVVDGDTVDLACSDGRVRLRLWGIDAPERGQSPWGAKATAHLQFLLRGSEFQIRVLDTDIYNRAVGVILDAGSDVGLRMVSDGWAAVRTRYVKDTRYRDARSDARRRGIGIWSAPGLQQKPWEWRRLNPRTVGS